MLRKMIQQSSGSGEKLAKERLDDLDHALKNLKNKNKTLIEENDPTRELHN